MMNTSKGNTYASKVTVNKSGEKQIETKSGGKTYNIRRRSEGLERLMVQEPADESGITVDEVPHDEMTATTQQNNPSNRHQQQFPEQPQQMVPYMNYNNIPPPNIYTQGSPPLPLAGPLQLVYLQSTAYGVNIIPFQAAGGPSFSPCSPLGFPAHPNHPVVVQSPSPQPYSSPELINTDVDCQYVPPPPTTQIPPPYPYLQTPYFAPHTPYHMYQDHPQGYPEHHLNASSYRSQKFFRPWEDQTEVANYKPEPKNPVKFDEEDFPSLESGLSKMNIK